MSEAYLRTFLLSGFIAVLAMPLHVAPAASPSDPFHSLVQQYCVDCHSEHSQEGGIDLLQHGEPFANRSDDGFWQRVHSALTQQAMPPAEEAQPTGAERRLAIAWLDEQRRRAAKRLLKSRPPTHLRRLTVGQYNHTMQDLFGVDAQFAGSLPPDPISPAGYQNDAQLLGLSSLQLEYYLEIAQQAVDRYIRFEQVTEQPLYYFVELEDLYYTVRDRVGSLKRAPQPITSDELARRRQSNRQAAPKYGARLAPLIPGDLPTTERLRLSQPKLHQQYMPAPRLASAGDLIVRVKAAATIGSRGAIPRLRVECGVAYGDGDGIDAVRLGEIDVRAPFDAPEMYEFRVRLEDVPQPEHPEQGTTIFEIAQLFFANVDRDPEAIYELGPGSYNVPEGDPNAKKNAKARKDLDKVAELYNQMEQRGASFLHLDSVEIEIVPNVGNEASPKWLIDHSQVKSGPENERKLAEGVLQRFMSAAYRRPLTSSELDSKLQLFDQLRRREPFESALRSVLVSVLTSPHFLMLDANQPGNNGSTSHQVSPHQLASRLSYLLWMTMPDDSLRTAASSGELSQQKVLRDEAERLLDDARSDRFLRDFALQWLRLDKFPLVAVNPEYYPEYDDDLADDTVEQTIRTFVDLFRSNRSALELIDSRQILLNDRLARHYRLALVGSNELQSVSLPDDSQRGGLLTQAAVMTLNSDGADSHPIRRGVWILDRLLGAPPPPPLPNVPDLDRDDPNLVGLSLKQKIERHRDDDACRSCHRKIDPWGIALEHFDATGRWRDEVRVIEDGVESHSAVDSKTVLADGTKLEGIADLKRFLLEERRDDFSRSLVEHMMTYSLGRQLDLADQIDAESIHEQFVQAGFRLRELVLAIVTSDAMRR